MNDNNAAATRNNGNDNFNNLGHQNSPGRNPGHQINDNFNNPGSQFNNYNSQIGQQFGRKKPPMQICEDKQTVCAGIQMICHGENADWMNKNCQKTCKKCPSGKTKLDI